MNRWVLAAVVGVVAVVAVGAATVWGSRPEKKPNVLIVLWDTVRADRLSMYGYSLDTSPRMKKWADERGVVFERAVSPDMWTVPSHASLFTGLPPGTHGAGYDHRWLDADKTTLAEWFGQHGWDTYAFSANPNLSPKRVNLLQGFTDIEVAWAKPWRDDVVGNTRNKLLKRDRSTEISPASKGKHGTGFYNAGPAAHQALTGWLDRRPDDAKPWLAYLSYMEAHKPRVPWLENRKKVADDETIQLGLQTDLSLMSQLLYSYGKKTYTSEELVAINRVYDASLLDLDDATADLLEDLDARGVLDDTIVVFTADHGEQLGEHQQFGHRSGIYQALLHVPLVISYPRKLEPRRVTAPVSNLQTFHTLLELAGLPSPETGHVTGNLLTVAEDAVDAIFSETLSVDRGGFNKVKKRFPELGRDVWANTYRSVVLGDWKLIQTVSFDTHDVLDCELYDVTRDPTETKNVFAEQAEVGKDLVARLEGWTASRPAWDAAKGDAYSDELSESAKKQLEMLGYVDEEPGTVDPDAPTSEELREMLANAPGNRCRLP